MKTQLVTVCLATVLLAACGQSSSPTASSSSAASAQAAATRLRSYCEQNRSECWFGAQNQARVAQDRAAREASPSLTASIPELAGCDDAGVPRPGRASTAACPLAAARVAVLSRPKSETHRVLLAERQRDRAPTLKFDPNARSEPQVKWFAHYFAENTHQFADGNPAATQLSMDSARDDAPRGGYRLRFLDPTAGAER